MKLKMYSVFDSKAVAYGTPFFMHGNGVAVRAFMDLVNDPKSTVNRYPDDFVLYELGEFDDSDGTYVALPNPVSLGHGSSFLRSLVGSSVVNGAKEIGVVNVKKEG